MSFIYFSFHITEMFLYKGSPLFPIVPFISSLTRLISEKKLQTRYFDTKLRGDKNVRTYQQWILLALKQSKYN